MSDFPQTLSECSVIIPNALQELIGNQERNKQISDYCKNAFEQEDKNTVFQQTKIYALDSLLNVTYNVYKMGNQIKNYLDLQEKELEKLQLQLNTLSTRINRSHSMRGKACFKSMEDPKEYHWHARETKQQLGSIPGFQRQPLSLRMGQYDNVGICLQRSENYDPNWQMLPGYNPPSNIELTSVSTGGMNQFAPMQSSDSSVPYYETTGYTQSYDNNQSYSTPTSNFPPPPSTGYDSYSTPPPPMGGGGGFPPPPPGNFDFPPPPPGDFGGGGFGGPPPPPPMGGGNNFPPPPPGNFDFPPPPPGDFGGGGFGGPPPPPPPPGF